MKIIKIEPIVLEQKLDRAFYFSQWTYDCRTICIVKITTDDGTIGWGEGYGPAHIIKSSIEFFTPLLLGRNPLEQENLWQDMHRRALDFARSGIILSALSAIDNALWDLKGKTFNKSVALLLGGRKRESVPVYASGMYFFESDDLTNELAKEAVLHKQAGFSAMKMKVGLGVKKDLENIIAIRKAIGDDVELMIDSNHAFDLCQAIQLAQAAEPYDISWFEEPLAPDDYENHYELRQKTSIPISSGECEYGRSGFLRLFQEKAIDIAQPDLGAAGGLTEVNKIAAMAQTFGVKVIPHCWGTGIAIATTLQFLANLDMTPGRMFEPEPYLELDRSENALREELVMQSFQVENGRMNIPDKAGLGIEINEKTIEKYRIA